MTACAHRSVPALAHRRLASIDGLAAVSDSPPSWFWMSLIVIQTCDGGLTSVSFPEEFAQTSNCMFHCVEGHHEIMTKGCKMTPATI